MHGKTRIDALDAMLQKESDIFRPVQYDGINQLTAALVKAFNKNFQLLCQQKKSRLRYEKFLCFLEKCRYE